MNKIDTSNIFSNRIILLTKGEESNLQTQLAPFIRPGHLTVDSTLIFMGVGVDVRSIHGYFKKFPRINMTQDINSIVEHVVFFIEAGIEAGTPIVYDNNIPENIRFKNIFKQFLGFSFN